MTSPPDPPRDPTATVGRGGRRSGPTRRDLGGEATRRDVAGAPAGTHDYDIVLDDRVIALEVTQHAVGPILAQRALEEKLDWSFDELRFCWLVNVREPCDLHRLRSEIVDVLRTFEADGRDRWLANQSAEDAALDGRLQRLGVKLIYRLIETTPARFSSAPPP